MYRIIRTPKEIPINTQSLALTLVDCPLVSSYQLTIGHRHSSSHRHDRYTISGPLILNQRHDIIVILPWNEWLFTKDDSSAHIALLSWHLDLWAKFNETAA
ncbi:unnamed protein product [Camellia sinensis]